jgi:hypothetical protein
VFEWEIDWTLEMLKVLAVGVSLFVAAQITHGAELFPSGNPRNFEMAERLELDATLGGYPVWKGDGKWRIFDLSKSFSTGIAIPMPIGTAGFFQTEGKKWVANFEVRANLHSGSGYWTAEPCKRDDMLFKLQLGGGFEESCVTINHITRYFGNPSGKNGELYAMFKEQGVDIPPTVLKVDITRNSTRLRMLNYSIWINPEFAGFEREAEPEWGRNPWNKTMSFKDPAKKQYIDALAAWATAFLKQMDDGLQQNQSAFANIPTWRTIGDGLPKPAELKSKITLD